MGSAANKAHRGLWNKVKIVGQKVVFKLKDIEDLSWRWSLMKLTQAHHLIAAAGAQRFLRL